MKKVITSIVTATLLVAPVIVLAQAEGPIEAPEWGDLEICCDEDSLLNNIADWLFVILIVIAAIAIIIAAYLFVTAAGDPDKTKKARDFVLYALIGVLVAFAAKGLVMLMDRIVRG